MRRIVPHAAAIALAVVITLRPALAQTAQPAAEGWGWRSVVSTETVVHGVGALIGVVAFNFYVAPVAAASAVGGPLQTVLSSRIGYTSLAAAGAVLTTYVYDRWTDQPIDYTYFWSRAGAIVGVGAGTAALAAFGYPPSIVYPRFSPAWVASRSFLVGAGLAGAYLTDIWLRRNQPQTAAQ